MTSDEFRTEVNLRWDHVVFGYTTDSQTHTQNISAFWSN